MKVLSRRLSHPRRVANSSGVPDPSRFTQFLPGTTETLPSDTQNAPTAVPPPPQASPPESEKSDARVPSRCRQGARNPDNMGLPESKRCRLAPLGATRPRTSAEWL